MDNCSGSCGGRKVFIPPSYGPQVILGEFPRYDKRIRHLYAEYTALLLLLLYILITYGERTTHDDRWNMKFTCNTKDIASAVGAASKVVNAHTTVPILSNVLLQAEDGKIAVRATDLELTLEHAFPAEIAESGSVTVPAKLFSSYLGNLPAGMLELTGTPTRASVKYERSNYDFHALPPDEYPPLPAATRGSHFTIAAKKFREGDRQHDLRRVERGGARRRADGDAARARRQRAHDGRDRRLSPREVHHHARRRHHRQRTVHRAVACAGRSVA